MEKIIEKKELIKKVVIILVVFITIWGLFLKFGDAVLIYKRSYKPMINWTAKKRFFWTLSPFHNANTFNYKIKDFIKNIIAFIPYGFCISLVLKNNKVKILKVLLFSFLLTFFIEIMQFLTIMGGIASNDLIANTLGGIVGYFVYIVFCVIIRNKILRNYLLLILLLLLSILSIYAIYTIFSEIELIGKMIFRQI